MKTVHFVIGILLGLYGLASAQPYVAWVKHYGPEQGLAHREVNAIAQDRQGFMWFGTKFGLSRFDGKTFTTFTKNRNGLDFDDIQSIVEDANGILWLKGANDQPQITLFNPLTSKTVPFRQLFKQQLPPSSINNPQDLFNSDDGTVFFTNYQPARLISYHPASGVRMVAFPQFKNLGMLRVTPRNTVWALADGNQLLELTADGRVLHQFSHNQGVVTWGFGKRNTVGVDLFYSVHHAARGGVNRFFSVDESGHRREWPFALLKPMIRYVNPVCYPIDRAGLFWDGISLRDSINRVLLSIGGQTAGETIENRSFYADLNGLLWLGTSFGVYQVKLTQSHFHRLLYQESNKGGQVAAIRGIAVLDDEVYANLEKFGLYRTPKQGGDPKKLYPNTTSSYVLTQDGQGRLYSNNGDQVVHYDPLTGNSSTLKLTGNNSLWSLCPVGSKGWIAGSQKGLLWFNTQTKQLKPFTQYNQFTELSQAHILYIAPDHEGVFWICTNTGLYSFDPAKGITARFWSGGRSQFYLPADSYQHFYQDQNGTYWLATANAGIIRWNRRQRWYRQFRRKEGLSNDNIYAVYPDQRGKLWLSSDYGIMQFDPVRLTTRSYFVQDGITHDEFNRIAHFQDKTGRIYFGGLNGITAFDPRDFEAEKPPASLPMRIVSFHQFDNTRHQLIDKTGELLKTHEIVIRPGDQTAVLEVAMLNFADAEKNVYAYQFKGLDNTWRQQPESSLRLGNLPYGTYHLLIKGQAANGQWSANTLVIRVAVQRPFYLQAWFVGLLALLLLVGIWGWLKWRIWKHQQEQIRLQNEIRHATARIEADKEVIEAQARALLQLNETRSRFFANISHEFRTPLTVILGMVSELKRYAPEEIVQQRQRVTGLIERNSSNLLRLINQILDLSKLEAGEMHLQPIRADLVSFTRYVSESFHTMAAMKQIALHFQTDEETLETDFDRDKLQDILSNLLTNAIKFTPAGGQVQLQLTTQPYWQPLEGYYEAISPMLHRHDPWLCIRIRDTGPGIHAEKLPLIFDRFYQQSPDAVDNQPIAEIGGTGIGLSLVRELVALMQGGLGVRSAPGQGTEFVVSIRQTRQAVLRASASEPVAEPVIGSLEDKLDAVEPLPATSVDKPVLLVVEDNEDVAAYILTCLQSDYQIIRADNGQTGVDLAFGCVPDLILSDVMMPQKDGFQLCDTLKNDTRTSHIPIVLLTARAAVSDRISGLRRGADAYLTKPFQQEELQVVLNNLLQSRQVLQQHYSQLALQSSATGPSPAVSYDNDSLEDQFLRKLQLALEPHLDTAHFSIEELCQHLGMSRATLHRKLVALTGLSLTHYVRALRLGRAKGLIASTSLTISEVAYAVGFDDPHYFSRVFSEEFGVSPTNFRLSTRMQQ